MADSEVIGTKRVDLDKEGRQRKRTVQQVETMTPAEEALQHQSEKPNRRTLNELIRS